MPVAKAIASVELFAGEFGSTLEPKVSGGRSKPEKMESSILSRSRGEAAPAEAVGAAAVE